MVRHRGVLRSEWHTPRGGPAVGDGLNDLDMLRNASLRIGVRGGCDEVMEMAHCLINGPERKGWQDIVRRLEDWT